MAPSSTLSSVWACPGPLFPGVGPRLSTFRRGLLKLRATAAKPKSAGFAGFGRFNRVSPGLICGRRFCVPPERAPGAPSSPTSTARPPEFRAWVYHALGGGALDTILSMFSIAITLTGIVATILFQRAQMTGVLPVMGGYAVAGVQQATVRVVPDRSSSQVEEADGAFNTAASRRGGSVASHSSITTADATDNITDDYSVAGSSEPERVASVTMDMAQRHVVPYGSSVADHVHDTPWSNLCRWAVYALEYQEALAQQAKLAQAAASTAATELPTVALSAEQVEVEAAEGVAAADDRDSNTSFAASAASATEVADSVRNVPTGRAAAAITRPFVAFVPAAVPPEVGFEHGIGPGSGSGSVAEVQTMVRRPLSVARGVQALLRLSRHATELPLRLVDWAIQADQPIRHRSAPATASPRDAANGRTSATTATVPEVDAAGTIRASTPARTPMRAHGAAPVTATADKDEAPVVSVLTAAADMSAQSSRLLQEQLPEKKGRDPWTGMMTSAATEVEGGAGSEAIPNSEPVEAAVGAATEKADVKGFATAAANAAPSQYKVYGKVSADEETATSLPPAVIASLPGGAATAVFALALSSWLSAWAVVLLGRAASHALGRIAGGKAAAAVAAGISTREYFGPWYDYVRQVGPGYPRTCVPICTPSPPPGVRVASLPSTIATAPRSAAVRQPPVGGAAGSSSPASLDYQLQQVPVAQVAVTAAAALGKAVQAQTAVPAVTQEDSQLSKFSGAAPASDAVALPLVAGAGAANLEDMAALMRLMPPPPSRRGWAGSAAAAAGLKPNPSVLTDPTSNMGLTPSSAAAEAEEAAAAAAAASARGERDGPRERNAQRRAMQRTFAYRLKDAMDRRITAAAAAAAAASAAATAAKLPPEVTESAMLPPTMATVPAALEAAKAGVTAIPVVPEEVVPAPVSSPAPSAPDDDIGALTAAADGADGATSSDDFVPEVEDDGANWQLGPACELAVPLAVPFAVPLAVPVPPAVPLPLSAAELAAPPLSNPTATNTQATSVITMPEAAGGAVLEHLASAAVSSPTMAEFEATNALPPEAVVSAPADGVAGQATVRSVVSVPGLHLSTTINQPGTAFVIRYQPPQPQQQRVAAASSMEPAATAAENGGCSSGTADQEKDLPYEERLQKAIKAILSSGGATIQGASAGAAKIPSDVEANEQAASHAEVERQLYDVKGLVFLPVKEWGTTFLRGAEVEDRDNVSSSGISSEPLAAGLDTLEAKVEEAVEEGENGDGGSGGSHLLPAVVLQKERGIVKASPPLGPVEAAAAAAVAAAYHRGPVTRGSLHSQTVTVTIDTNAVGSVSNVKVDVAPAAAVAAAEVVAVLPPRTAAGVLPPPPSVEAPWVLAAPAVMPTSTLLTAALRTAAAPVPVSEESTSSKIPQGSASPLPTAATAALNPLEDMVDTGIIGPRAQMSEPVEATSAASPDATEGSALRKGDWAFYAGQYNGMMASELRPYHADGKLGQQGEAATIMVAAVGTSAPISPVAATGLPTVTKEQQQQQPAEREEKEQQKGEEGSSPNGALKNPVFNKDPESATTDAAAGTAYEEQIDDSLLLNCFTGVPELDRAVFGTGGVVPGAWTTTGGIKVGSSGVDGGAPQKAASATAAAATAAAAPGPTGRRGMFYSRRRRASLLRLRSEAAKAAAVAAATAANAATATTLYGVRLDDIFSTSEDSAFSAPKANLHDHEYTDDVLNALAALVAAASGAASPIIASQLSATVSDGVAEAVKATKSKELEDMEALEEMVALAAAANGAAAPQHTDAPVMGAASAPIANLEMPPSSMYVTAAAAVASQEYDFADLLAQADLAAAANGAVTNGSMRQPLTSTSSSTPMARQTPTTTAERPNMNLPITGAPRIHTNEEDMEEYDTTDGRHFMPLASAIAMFNQYCVPTATKQTADADADIIATGMVSEAPDIALAPSTAWRTVRGTDAKAQEGDSEAVAKTRATTAADLPPPSVTSAFVLPPAGSLAATAVGLGIATAAAGAAVVHAAEAAEDLKGEEAWEGFTDQQAQAAQVAAAAAAAEATPMHFLSAAITPCKAPADADEKEEPGLAVAAAMVTQTPGTLAFGPSGMYDDDVESQLRYPVNGRSESGWDLDPDYELRCGFTGAQSVPPLPTTTMTITAEVLATHSVETSAPVAAAAAAAAVDALSNTPVAAAAGPSPVLPAAEAVTQELTTAIQVPVQQKEKAVSPSPAATAAVQEDEEADEMAALTWLAGLMGVAPPEGSEVTDGGKGTEEHERNAGTAPATARVLTAASEASINCDVEVTFGDTAVFLPEEAVPPGFSPAKTAVPSPRPAPSYTTYWSVPESSGTSAEMADVNPFALSESSREDEEEEGVVKGKGEEEKVVMEKESGKDACALPVPDEGTELRVAKLVPGPKISTKEEEVDEAMRRVLMQGRLEEDALVGDRDGDLYDGGSEEGEELDAQLDVLMRWLVEIEDDAEPEADDDDDDEDDQVEFGTDEDNDNEEEEDGYVSYVSDDEDDVFEFEDDAHEEEAKKKEATKEEKADDKRDVDGASGGNPDGWLEWL